MNDAIKINSSKNVIDAPRNLTDFATRGEKFIVFTIEEAFYGIASKEVIEIIRPLAVTALPNVPRWISGIMNLRGEIVPVVDLQKLWNKNSVGAPKLKFILLRSGAISAGIAFAVDRLCEIVSLPDTEIEPESNQSVPQIFGKAVYKSNVLRLINAKNLFDSLCAN